MGFLISLAVAVLISGVTIVTFKNQINISLMKFFRNLSRFKARRRLYGNEASLIPILMGKEKDVVIIQNNSEESDGFTMTAAELREMDGRTENTPIYIAVRGYIFDISAGRNMYGPGSGYHSLVGREAASAFAHGCSHHEVCFQTPVDQLTPEQLLEVDRWIDLYRNHDKYKLVGRLVSDPVDQIVDNELHSDQHENETIIDLEATESPVDTQDTTSNPPQESLSSEEEEEQQTPTIPLEEIPADSESFQSSPVEGDGKVEDDSREDIL